LTVHVPAGVHDGQVVRIRGEGEPNAAGTSRGDLHCYIKVRQHPLLARRGDDLICQVPISFTQAALGCDVQVPTLAGTQQLDIPAGTQSSSVFTLKKLGLPAPGRNRRGDLHVQVFVEVPRKLSDKQRELLEAYGQTEESNLEASHPDRKTFFDKVKEYFAK
jgi:molecular chaperone DnaJ